MIKLLLVGRGRVGMDPAEQRAYMKDSHGAAVVRLIAEDPGIAPSRYVQNHVTASYAAGGAEPDARDFATQIWFDDPAHMQAALTTPRYVDDLQPDEANFVDRPSVTMLPLDPTVVVEPAGGAAKVLVLLASDVPDPTVYAADSVRGHVRNQVTRPGAPFEAVDELWFDDREAADAAARGWVDGAALPASLVLVADTYVLHDGPGA